jgi:hypothetical protein
MERRRCVRTSLTGWASLLTPLFSRARTTARKVGQQIAARGASHKGVGINRFISAPVEAAEAVSRQFDQERFLTVVASFALGYLAALLFHGRVNAQFGMTSGPFQITKPPKARNIRKASLSRQCSKP